MKKLTLFILMIIGFTSFAQMDVSVYGGYQFGSKAYGYNGTLRLKSNANYGVIAEFGVAPDLMVQLQWMGSATEATLEGPFYDYVRTDVNVNYYQIGMIRPFPVNEKVEAFGNFTLGATQFAMQNQLYNDEWRFSITAGLGTKIWLSDVVGIRLQARLLAPINWGGLGFFCGTGGCGSSVSAGSSFISGDVSGGLVFRLRDM